MKTSLLATAAALALSACSHVPYAQAPVFDPGEHALYSIDQNGTLRGESAYRDTSGQTFTCAGQLVHLVPDTSYFRQLLELDRSGYYLKTGVDPSAQALVRTTVCDKEGLFTFEHLPQARWIAVSRLSWGYEGEDPATSHQVLLNKPLYSRADRTDEVYVLESDTVYEVPDSARLRLHEAPLRTVAVAGGECDEERLGKEDVLPAYCHPKRVVHRHRHSRAAWMVDGDK